jgi:outer membrane protein OmpA-like peptidoglycan-associated protein
MRDRRNPVADHLAMKLLKPVGGSPAAAAAEGGYEQGTGGPSVVAASVVAASAEPAPFVYAERRASEARDHLATLVGLRREKRGDVMTLQSDKLVEPGQWAITGSGQFKLREIAPGLRDQEGHAILIQGYTDSAGSAAVNDALSLRRAEAVREYLITQGVGAEAMRAEGLGAKRPVGPNSTPDGRAQNRRIEIVIAP